MLVTLMMNDMEQADIDYIVERKRGKLRILKNKITCDYYEYINGIEQARAGFHGEYMSRYSWAEETLASIIRQQNI